MASQKKVKKAAGSKGKPEIATAFHVQSEDGAEHLVGIGNLRVLLFHEENSWFAQGLEIDYFAQGDSLEDVKERFQDGLHGTVDLHLKVHGHIFGVLKPAPQEVWAEFYNAKPTVKKYSQVSFHLPFQCIEYYGLAEAG